MASYLMRVAEKHPVGFLLFWQAFTININVTSTYAIWQEEIRNYSPMRIVSMLSVVFIMDAFVLFSAPRAMSRFTQIGLFILYISTLATVAMAFSTFFYHYGLYDVVTGSVVKKNVFDAFYFSGSSMLTLSYGDFRPWNTLTREIALAEGFVGYVALGVFIAGITRSRLKLL